MVVLTDCFALVEEKLAKNYPAFSFISGGSPQTQAVKIDTVFNGKF
jgi:hypothetical protein